MNSRRMHLAPLAFAMLGACSSQPGNDAALNAALDNQVVIDSVNDSGPPIANTSPIGPPAPGTPGGLANDMTSVSEGNFPEGSAQAAAQVVELYYAQLEEGSYAPAWALWEDGGRASGMGADAFAASFAKYGEYHANIGAPGDIDAGAGQRYVKVPVVVYGRMKDGRPFNMKGDVTLHRTEVDGATPEQRRWRIRSADIKPRP